jgi:hypothetical protein
LRKGVRATRSGAQGPVATLSGVYELGGAMSRSGVFWSIEMLRGLSQSEVRWTQRYPNDAKSAINTKASADVPMNAGMLPLAG